MNHEKLIRLLIGEFSLQRIVRSILFIYVALAFWAYFFSDSMIFLLQDASYQDSHQILKLTSGDDVQISAMYLPNPEARYTILYSHGNAEDLGDILPSLQQIHDIGFAVFAYDYQGYGTSEGSPRVHNTYKDIDAAYAYLTQQIGVPGAKIIIYGRSVGGGPSVDLASRVPVGGLVVESSFVSIFRVVTQIPIFPFDKFRNINKIKQVHCPVLVIHGSNDEVIPFWHGQKLFAMANEPKRYLWVEGAGHNDVMWVADERYVEALREFELFIDQNSVTP